MASTDARPVPIKNTAFRITFPIFDNTGALVSGAAGLDSEVSKDGATFADCTNEATEIATSSGMYYLDLTSSEMNADCVSIIVKTSTTNAKTTPIVLYPQESGDIKVDLQSVLASGTAATNMQLAALSMATGTVDNTGFTATSTIIETSITTATADYWKDRIIFFTSGALIQQAARITAYALNSGRGRFTVTALTAAPANGVSFLIV